MDQIKLEKWLADYNRQAQRLQIEFDSFFQDSDITASYIAKVDMETQNLQVIITNPDLPLQIKEQLEKLVISTKPEDSV